MPSKSQSEEPSPRQSRSSTTGNRAAEGQATDPFGSEAFYQVLPVSDRDRRWGCYVTVIGATRLQPHSHYPVVAVPGAYHYVPPQTRVLHEHQITYISRGAGWLETRVSGRQRIEAGNVYLLFPGVCHFEMPDPETGWDEHYICFDGEVARRVMGRKFFPRQQPVLEVVCQKALFELFTGAVTVARAHKPAMQQLLAGILQNILGQLYSDQNSVRASLDQAENSMQRAITAVRESLASRLDLNKLAEDLGLSYSSLRHQFARHTGMSPHQYLLNMRLARARDLLTNTTLSAKAIARESGFHDEQYFSRVFRSKIGMPPAEWRAWSLKRGGNSKR